MVEFSLVPGHVALLNIDLQNCFVEAAEPRGLEVLDRVNGLAAVCRSVGIPVFQVRHALAAGADPGVLGEIFPGVLGLLDRDSATAAFHPGLVLEPGDVLLEKPHFGAFHDTDLDQQLRGRGVDTVIVTGIETNICCETTAREAMVREYRVLVMSDGTTTGGVPGLSVEEVQRASLASLALCFAQVATVADTTERIRTAYST
jgi:ureidoacrylate peracid hydrolase